MLDAIDLSTVTIHDSPADVVAWQITATITGVLLANDTAPADNRGFAFAFASPLPEAWKARPAPDSPPGDNVQFTVWALVRIDGAWHGAAFIEMWQGRPATGAPIEEHWRDWAYDANRWGPMVGYVPRPGDVVGLFVSAGNGRGQQGPTSVRERSQVVTIVLPLNDVGAWPFPSVPEPHGGTPAPPPAPPQPQAPPPASSDEQAFAVEFLGDLERLINGLTGLHSAVVDLTGRFDGIAKNGIRVHL